MTFGEFPLFPFCEPILNTNQEHFYSEKIFDVIHDIFIRTRFFKISSS
jgi:hypothetical protein